MNCNLSTFLFVLVSSFAFAFAFTSDSISSTCKFNYDIEKKYEVELITVNTDGKAQLESSSSQKTVPKPPPKPLLIAIPKCDDCSCQTFPVVMFNHGFNLNNRFYSQIITLISSYGFIVVAPKMYEFTLSSDATQEMIDMISVINWLPAGLNQTFFTKTATPELDCVALVGHSRGGKVVFGLASGLVPGNIPYWAVVGLDPVDGTSKDAQTKPRVLTYKPSSLNISFPALLIGAGLGPVSAAPLTPACAAAEVGHNEFFEETKTPSYHFTALDFGHMDFLDDSTPGWTGLVTSLSCKNGAAREPVRNYSGQVVTSFLSSVKYGESSKFKNLLLYPDGAPIRVRTEWKDPSIQLPVSALA